MTPFHGSFARQRPRLAYRPSESLMCCPSEALDEELKKYEKENETLKKLQVLQAKLALLVRMHAGACEAGRTRRRA